MPELPANITVQSNVNLQSYNTLGVKANARWLVEVTSVKELEEVCKVGVSDPIFILGDGSNVLFRNDFRGLILHVNIQGKEIIKETGNHVWLKIGAGEDWHKTVRYCVDRGWGGIENLSLIPGTTGAAPIQNIGAYGVELEQVFEHLETVNLETGEQKTFNREECAFGYRDSIFKRSLKGRFLVSSVTLRLDKNHRLNTTYGAIQEKLAEKEILNPNIRDISDVVMEIRNSKLPNPEELGNAGSFFKNPVVSKSRFDRLKKAHPQMPGYKLESGKYKVPAGWLIDHAGWKGKVVGNTGTYSQQALVIVNHGGATGEEIWEFAERIQGSVKRQFGIILVPEVNIV